MKAVSLPWAFVQTRPFASVKVRVHVSAISSHPFNEHLSPRAGRLFGGGGAFGVGFVAASNLASAERGGTDARNPGAGCSEWACCD
jgi:hypothetical protein